ncbi:hypothetical protein ACJX0J_013295, partial [Zea mays]
THLVQKPISTKSNAPLLLLLKFCIFASIDCLTFFWLPSTFINIFFSMFHNVTSVMLHLA